MRFVSRHPEIFGKIATGSFLAYGGASFAEGAFAGDEWKMSGAATGTAIGYAGAQGGAALGTLIAGPLGGFALGAIGGLSGYFAGNGLGEAVIDIKNLPEEMTREHAEELVGSLPRVIRDRQTGEILDKRDQPFQAIQDPLLHGLSDLTYDYALAREAVRQMEQEAVLELQIEDYKYRSVLRRLENAIETGEPPEAVVGLNNKLADIGIEIVRDENFQIQLNEKIQQKFGEEYESALNEFRSAESFLHNSIRVNGLQIGRDYLELKRAGSEVSIEDYREQQVRFVKEQTSQAMEIFAREEIDMIASEYGFPEKISGLPLAEAVREDHVFRGLLSMHGGMSAPMAQAIAEIRALSYSIPRSQEHAASVESSGLIMDIAPK